MRERWYGERWYKGGERERERQIGEREGVCGERESRSKKGKIGTTNLACLVFGVWNEMKFLY